MLKSDLLSGTVVGCTMPTQTLDKVK
uniref:Uncharacterized protein n=1 Tax=Anguilla anguilla TaxID=7936 RepID=A0A0E9TSZ6_ANGAN